MKKFFILTLLFCITGVVANSQLRGDIKWTSYGLVADTLNNTTVETTNAFIVGQNGAFSATVTLALISGTSGGKIYWEAGNGNGFYWPVDSVTLTQQNLSSNSYGYSAAPYRYNLFRIRIVPTGTQSQRVVAAFYKQN
jgi:hypothetical protein